ncbi:MAG TPA: hypothetical protein VK335_02370 [Bryobacteraceae bacterium]|nr:hypothetical protein [Bryobacteraceae bacterium]
MKGLLLTFVLVAPLAAAGRGVARELDDVARIASVMVDGDACRRIVTLRALEFMFKNDPRDQWVAGDNYEVNDEAFIPVKKTLIRLSHLAPFPCDVNLWMPVAGHPEKVRIVIRNTNELSQFWPWGALYQDMIPSMKQVLETGHRVTVSEKPGWVSVLAPVYDSLGDIVGLVEAVTQQPIDPQGNVK